MEVDKYWYELFISMTEDENGRLRPSEEKELLAMMHDEFFIKLLIFRERLDQRKEALTNKK